MKMFEYCKYTQTLVLIAVALGAKFGSFDLIVFVLLYTTFPCWRPEADGKNTSVTMGTCGVNTAISHSPLNGHQSYMA